ncbi:MAG: PadR family transcriptional regulator [Promethearchaeota archaeon]
MVAEQDRHPYEIDQIIEERQMRNWTDIGKSSIYRILIKLEEKGLVIYRNEIKRGRNLKIYSITNNGKEVLKEFVFQTISKGRDFRRHFELALSNLPQLSKLEQIEAFKKSLQALKRDKKHINERFNVLPIKNPPFYVKSLFIRPNMLIDAQIKFIELALEELEKGD